MAHIVFRPSSNSKFKDVAIKNRPGKYRVTIRMQDPTGRKHKITQSFDTKEAAVQFVKVEEGKIAAGGRIVNDGTKSLRDVIASRKLVVSKGDRRILERWCDRQPLPFIDMPLSAIRRIDIIEWAAQRGAEMTDDVANPGKQKRVEPSTVRREWNVLSGAFSYAVGELEWLHASPVPKKVRGAKKDPRPKDNKPRKVRVTDEHIAAVAAAAELTPDGPITTHAQRHALGFELAVETTMRISDMVSLKREQIDFDRRVATVLAEDHKNGHEKDVALSTRACEILQRLLAASPDDRPFPMSPNYMSRIGTELRRAAGIPEVHCHDGRGEGITRISKRMTLLELAEQTGHQDLRMLKGYYRDSGAERAKLLD